MEKIYNEYFRVTDNEPLTNKVFLSRIMMSISVIVLCLTMATATAYAYYSYTISSRNNIIVSANYSLSIESKEGLNAIDGSYKLESGKEYHFLLDYAYSTATVGFCKIVVNGDEYFTQPIGTYLVNEKETTVEKRAVKITVPQGSTYTVKFVSEWGSCSKPAIDSTSETVSEMTVNAYSLLQIDLSDDLNQSDINDFNTNNDLNQTDDQQDVNDNTNLQDKTDEDESLENLNQQDDITSQQDASDNTDLQETTDESLDNSSENIHEQESLNDLTEE